MQPIFVTGIGRSGTSALLKCLVYHKNVIEPEVLGEAPFIGHFVNFIHNYENGTDREYRLKNYKLGTEERADAFGEMLYKLHIAPKNKEKAKTAAAKYWPAKAFPNRKNYSAFKNIFPGMKMMYIMRNGIEVVNSTRNFHGFSNLTFEDCCRRWAGSIQANNFLENRADVAFIKHHDMVTNPVEVLGDAFAEIGMARDPKPGEYIQSNIFNSSFDNTNENINAVKHFEGRLQAAWDAWTSEEQELFIKLCDSYMQSYGFALPVGYKGRKTVKAAAKKKPATKGKPSVEKPVKKPVAKAPAPIGKVSAASLTKAPGKSVLGKLNNRPKLRGSLEDKLEAYMPSKISNYCLHTSLRHGFTYVEVPKTGCTTVKHLVQKIEWESNGGVPEDRVKVGSHVHFRNQSPLPMFREMTKKDKTRSLSGKDMTIFTFVRNPFSRALSCYKSKVEVGIGPKKHLIAMRDGVKPEDADLTKHISFREFLELISTQDSKDMDIHWRPQVDQTMIDLVKYDFIGRYENFAADLNHIIKKISPDAFEFDIPRPRNKTKAMEELNAYYDDDCKKLVQKLYANDFAAFGYKTTTIS